MTPATEEHLAVVSAQLRRAVRDFLGIAARTLYGTPAVVATAPRLADRHPAPTFDYLTNPALAAGPGGNRNGDLALSEAAEAESPVRAAIGEWPAPAAQ